MTAVTPEAGAGGGGGSGGAAADEWETVIGLEVHAELKTATKLFCSCRNEFGGEPNTHVCPVCLGLPGSLPVLNARAVELAARIGLALHCEVRPSLFHRKNYFYPDMPKDYQVSQYDEPINVGGWLELPDGTRVSIERAHLEEDTGKTTHVGGGGRIHDAAHSLVDYNRAGVPLVEIVSAPDIRSGEQARAYVAELRAILVATDASDGRMEEGSLRVDANVSVRRRGSDELGTRAEVKNLNSLRSLGRAIDHEAARQIAILTGGGRVTQETRHWDENAGRTISGRTKEQSEDYRYFPEPDLVPIVPDDDWLAGVAASLPLLPAGRRDLLEEKVGAEPAEAAMLVELGLDDLVIAAVERGADARVALNRAANEVAADLEAAGRLDVEHFAALVRMESAGELTATQAKAVLGDMLAGGGDPASIAKARGFEAMGSDELVAAVEAAIAANPAEWERFKEGEAKLAGFFVGQVMKATKGRADGGQVTAELRRRAG
ncbi:MAG TPA: Asp-tRNA(Asn)/Glu-tRNA(Gln) amidotransferase subunit GatB [Acidimicrobiales bacterium]|nr:Asp-tRNA(Asn)/Glu-tRNA(Gln) amidotransferase subunit GatB [Acidimicrobiales bacterium]